MRKAWLLLLLAPSALVWACGGGDNTDLDGGSDAQGDGTVKNDSGGDSASDTGVTTDGSTDAINSDVDTDGGQFNVACRYPYECIEGGIPDAAYPPNSGVVCCGTLVLSGQVPNCDFDSLTTVCAQPTSCVSNVQLTCTTDTIRGCAHTAECTEQAYNKCCHTNGFGDGGANFCMGAALAQELGASCLP